MNANAWLMLGLCVLLFCGLGISAARLWKYKKKRAQLEGQINSFLQNGRQVLPFSVADDSFAPLENAIAQLEEQILLERGRQEKIQQKESRLIADISHQLKTPLAGLKLFCEMDEGPHSQKQLALIGQMNGLIYSLLRLEKLRVGAYEMRFAPCELGSLTREIGREMGQMYAHIAFDISGDAQLRCDAGWMREAHCNLIKNACEHGKKEVGVKVEETQESVLIHIEDDGPGVAEENLPILFERFSRLSERAGKGTGLGLAIAKAIVEKHHGMISAKNAKPGLVIQLSFPRIEGIQPL